MKSGIVMRMPSRSFCGSLSAERNGLHVYASDDVEVFDGEVYDVTQLAVVDAFNEV